MLVFGVFILFALVPSHLSGFIYLWFFVVCDFWVGSLSGYPFWFFLLLFCFVVFFFSFFNCVLGFGVHVKNTQDCCIGTYTAL